MGKRERTIAWCDPYAMAADRLKMDGLSFFRGIASGDLPPAPLYPFINLSILEVDEGRCLLSCEPTDQLYNPLSWLHGGVPASLADTAMGISIQSTLAPGLTVATIGLHIDYLRSATEATGTLLCEGRCIRAGRRVAVAVSEIKDAAGELYYRAHATFMVMPARAREPGPAPERRERTFSWPDPEIVPAAQREHSGMELLRMMVAGELPRAPIGETLDFDMTEIEPGRAVFECRPQEFHYNPMGGMHGGVPATLLDSATGVAVHSTVDPGLGFTTIFLRVEFFKGITVETGPLRCEGRLVKDGARIAIADGELTDAAGTVYARGSSTCMKLGA